MPTNNLVPSDCNDYLYRATYFLLKPFVPFIPCSISPNTITLCAFLSAMVGTALLMIIPTPAAYLYWVLFNFIWFILDALDGLHARYTHQTSEYGAFLDHALDNIYFIFMFTVFAYRFDLLHMLYVYIIALRITASLMVYLVHSHTRHYILGRFTGGLEFLLMNAAMILSYYYPYINPTHLTQNHFLLQAIHFLDLQHGLFMKLALLVYFVGVPINVFLQFRFVRSVVT